MGIPQLPTDTAPGFVGLDVPGGDRVDDGWVVLRVCGLRRSVYIYVLSVCASLFHVPFSLQLLGFYFSGLVKGF